MAPPRRSLRPSPSATGAGGGGRDPDGAAAGRAGAARGCVARGRSPARRRMGGIPPPSAPPEPTPALLEGLERLLEGSAVEVRPELVAEHELGVRALPEQEVRDPLFAAGADQKVRVVHLGRVQ